MAHEKFGESVEAALIEAGAISIRSKNRREVLGCLGCQFLKAQEAGEEPAVHGWKIIECMGREKTWPVYVPLHKLEESGALASEQVTEGSAGPARRIYRPANTPLGRLLMNSFIKPDDCPIETQQLFQDEPTG